MFSGLEHYQQGHFFFQKGDNLSTVSESVPDLPGIYYVVRLAKGRMDIVYIGKSGTISQEGNLAGQDLRSSIRRQAYFSQKVDNEPIDALDIYWFVTMDENNKDLPGYVEGLLMQQYFEIYGQTPEWNESY